MALRGADSDGAGTCAASGPEHRAAELLSTAAVPSTPSPAGAASPQWPLTTVESPPYAPPSEYAGPDQSDWASPDVGDPGRDRVISPPPLASATPWATLAPVVPLLVPAHGPGPPGPPAATRSAAACRSPASATDSARRASASTASAFRAVSLRVLQAELGSLQQRGSLALPELSGAFCRIALEAASGTPRDPRPRGVADDRGSVLAGSPFPPCPPGPWADAVIGPRPGPLCHCGARNCASHFPVVDVDGVYGLHCEFVCQARRCGSDGQFLDPVAHAACPIHTVLSLASGVWVPWLSPGSAPQIQQRAPRVRIGANTPEGAFVTAHLADGVVRGFWEREADPSDFSQCSIIEAGFVATSLKPETAAEHSDSPAVDVPSIDTEARRRASDFVTQVSAIHARGGLTKSAFFRLWAAVMGGLPKYRFCVGHDFFLNRACGSWSLQFPTAHAMLEAASPGDFFLVRDT